LEPIYLFDPWLVEVSHLDTPEVAAKRYEALIALGDLHRKYGMRPVCFLPYDRIQEFYSEKANSQRRDWHQVFRIMTSIFLAEKQGQHVEILGTPCPDLPEDWLCALGECGCDEEAPSWRKPVVFLAEVRSSAWPNHAEKNRVLSYKAKDGEEKYERNLVCIENYRQHAFFESDLDPWRLGHDPDSTKVLPRPIEDDILPLTFTFTQIFNKLQEKIEWTCGQSEKAYFIPEEGWDPRRFNRHDWRETNIFPKNTVKESRSKHNGRSGYVDREKRIWLWHNEEQHWDVQLTGREYWSISNNGNVLKRHI